MCVKACTSTEMLQRTLGLMEHLGVIVLQSRFFWKQDENQDSGENLKPLKKLWLVDYQRILLKMAPHQQGSENSPTTV